MDERARVYLLQMRDAARDALFFVEGFSEAQFMADKRTQQAVCLSLILIGENAIKLQDGHTALVLSLVNIDWQSIRGMRNRLVHTYADTDLEIVWRTVQKTLPTLIHEVERKFA